MAKYDSVLQLYADVQNYVNTNESTLVATIPFWVSQAELELDRRLRHPAAEIISSFKVVAGGERIPAPIEMLELKSIKSRATGEMLYRRSYETLSEMYNPTKYPKYFASVANYFYLDKVITEDVTYEFVFYTSPDKLSNELTTNFYLAVLPDFLLYITLEQAFIFNGQPDQAAYWRNMGEQQLALLNTQIQREDSQGSTLLYMNDVSRNQYYF